MFVFRVPGTCGCGAVWPLFCPVCFPVCWQQVVCLPDFGFHVPQIPLLCEILYYVAKLRIKNDFISKII